MSITECTPDVFAKDIATHRLQILRDDGFYHHLKMRKPDSGDMHYHIVTWPGYLAYTGDMGAYTFQRLDDMLEFFRAPPNQPGFINPGYWKEKLEAICTHSGVVEYDEESLVKETKRQLNQFLGEAAWPEEVAESLRDSVDDVILQKSSEESFATVSLYEFSFSEHQKGVDYSFSFDLSEASFKRESFHYIWCCHAIVHAIALYDEEKSKSA